MRVELPTVFLGLLTGLVFCSACSEEETSLVLELVPNPEINTRADVAERINTLDVILDARGGFENLDAEEGESWGRFKVTDFDGDGAMELMLTRPGQEALEPFAITQGSQDERMIGITAKGTDDEAVQIALGATETTFQDGRQVPVEVPFNLLPDYRPLRVLSMTPANGSEKLVAPVREVVLQLGGKVLETAFTGHFQITADHLTDPPALTSVVSHVQTATGWVTKVRLLGCEFYEGQYFVRVDTEVCSTFGQCLDQHLGIEGEQPFEGRFSVGDAGADPIQPMCGAGNLAPAPECEVPCEDGFVCENGECVTIYGAQAFPDEDADSSFSEPEPLGCDPSLCEPPYFVCDEEGVTVVDGEGAGEQVCVADCRTMFGGACIDPTLTCDPNTGLCT